MFFFFFCVPPTPRGRVFFVFQKLVARRVLGFFVDVKIVVVIFGETTKDDVSHDDDDDDDESERRGRRREGDRGGC